MITIQFLRSSIKTGENTSEKLVSILTIALVTMIILWVLQFIKTKKLKAKISSLENKN
jgi:hypothetical protein